MHRSAKGHKQCIRKDTSLLIGRYTSSHRTIGGKQTLDKSAKERREAQSAQVMLLLNINMKYYLIGHIGNTEVTPIAIHIQYFEYLIENHSTIDTRIYNTVIYRACILVNLVNCLSWSDYIYAISHLSMSFTVKSELVNFIHISSWSNN